MPSHRTAKAEPESVWLTCGIVAAVLYFAMNVLIPLQWQGYSFASQVISELSAIDAPTRSLWVPLGIAYSVLMVAFGWGVWVSGRGNRHLRIAGALILVYSIIGLAWPPMHQREVVAAGGGTLTDTLHIVWSVAWVAFMLASIAFGAAALGKRFRRYSIVTLTILVTFGVLTGLDAPKLSANLPTPLIGVWERIQIGVVIVWDMVLAIALLRRQPAAPRPADTLSLAGAAP
ncbi:MAG: DUF998 domain-containing protein [Gemmatimonadales bacterium]